ncbi:uncharacterized protein A1O9_12914 [Exophiala aquamarina CBS 119918]|uniref:Uncharacterized protein n=1 Tax=Exophiala aquamarina CBS 119918 TaxID=1182545 RepID=A0A072P5Y6_9EURO|nr:uncharacterized protein A1O9_12914 [Exophiala aquamarina CBS 119918]KEF51030.1 hypothetical protein A1O9_12914 [Exophiala aquamarina CBS 119918]
MSSPTSGKRPPNRERESLWWDSEESGKTDQWQRSQFTWLTPPLKKVSSSDRVCLPSVGHRPADLGVLGTRQYGYPV